MSRLDISQRTCSVPSKGRCNSQTTVTYSNSRPGQKYEAYPANPIAPDATDSGALNESCQMKRKEISRPSLREP